MSKVWIIPNGIDLNTFKPLNMIESRYKVGWHNSGFHVLFPSHGNHPRKRLDLAEAAVAELKHLGTVAELHQLNGVPHKEVPVWLNASDALILTSFHEGSPNIVKEALACNRPVVSVDTGDVRERIEGIEGCYLARSDPDDLAAKLQLALSAGPCAGGRTRMQELSLERVAQRVLEVYTASLSQIGYGEVVAKRR